jgi:GGDEF domain-containing protein
MTTTSSSSPSGEQALEQQQAYVLARFFNVAFSTACGYGVHHPTTRKSLQDFFMQLTHALQKLQRITLLYDRGSFFFDEWCVDTRINVRRMEPSFAKPELHSLTFERTVQLSDLEVGMDMLLDTATFSTSAIMHQDLVRRGISGIRINYVMFRKVTGDEAVVSQSQQSTPVSGGGSEVLAFDPLLAMGSVFSLKQLVDDPRAIAQTILGGVSSQGSDGKRAAISEQLRQLNARIGTEALGQGELSHNELIEAVYKLKAALYEGLALQRTMSRVMGEESGFTNDLEQLTFDTIVGIVRQEYRASELSPTRLAFIIRRLVPDGAELRRLLPQLKIALLNEGMSLHDFLAMVDALGQQLDSSHIQEALAQGAESLGVSTQEVVNAIQDYPEEAARLLVLAAEIRRGGGGSTQQLSQLLTDYVEQASGQMALKSAEALQRDGGKELRTIMFRLEKQLLDKLREQGISGSMLEAVEKQLAGRFAQTLSQLKSDWMIGRISRSGDTSTKFLMQLLDSMVEQEVDVENVLDPLRTLLQERGFTPQQLAEVQQYLQGERGGQERAGALPKGVMSTSNTLFFLQRQIRESTRYEHPFTVMFITVRSLRAASDVTLDAAAAARALMPQVFEIALKALRDLDIVGTISSSAETIPFIILPMTTEQGAATVRQRLQRQLEETPLGFGGMTLHLRVSISQVVFDKDQTPDVKALLGKLKVEHARIQGEGKSGGR